MFTADPDFALGGAIRSVLHGWGPRGPWQMTEYKPKGLWAVSRAKRPCRVHMISRALIAWRQAGGAQVGVLTRCGFVISNAMTSVEEFSDDYCDACLLADDEFAVYRHLDGGGKVLYIGYTSNLVARTDAHCSQSPWWPEVKGCSVETFNDELAARCAEIAAIAAERPPHNTVGVST